MTRLWASRRPAADEHVARGQEQRALVALRQALSAGQVGDAQRAARRSAGVRHERAHGLLVRAVVVAADHALAVDEHELRAVQEGTVAARRPLAGRDLHGRELEAARRRGRRGPSAAPVTKCQLSSALEGRGVAGQHLRRVVGGVDGEGDERHVRREVAPQAGHARGHGRAGPAALREDEVRHPGTAAQVGQRQRTAGRSVEPEVRQRAHARRLRRAAQGAAAAATATRAGGDEGGAHEGEDAAGRDAARPPATAARRSAWTGLVYPRARREAYRAAPARAPALDGRADAMAQQDRPHHGEDGVGREEHDQDRAVELLAHARAPPASS